LADGSELWKSSKVLTFKRFTHSTFRPILSVKLAIKRSSLLSFKLRSIVQRYIRALLLGIRKRYIRMPTCFFPNIPCPAALFLSAPSRQSTPRVNLQQLLNFRRVRLCQLPRLSSEELFESSSSLRVIGNEIPKGDVELDYRELEVVRFRY
jgi:hypothetical protein